jgi:2-oxoisovalerate dehydrogenase E1 component
VRRAREGRGPSLIEARTYRTRGHVEYEVTFITEPYRDEAEVDAWRARDPIARFARRLHEEDQGVADELAAIDAAVEETVRAAVRFAVSSPEPDPASARGQIFATAP